MADLFGVCVLVDDDGEVSAFSVVREGTTEAWVEAMSWLVPDGIDPWSRRLVQLVSNEAPAFSMGVHIDAVLDLGWTERVAADA